jgi:hypothetical protein
LPLSTIGLVRWVRYAARWRILYAGKNAGNTDIVAMLGTTGVGISISHADPAGTAILVLACDR